MNDLIQPMFAWLNCNSGAVNSILAFLLVGVTGAYVILTYCLLCESKKFREMSLRPALVMTVELHETYWGLFNFRLENIGGGAAHRIRLQTNRKLIVKGKDPLNKLGLFKHGLPSLGPARKIESFLASAYELGEAGFQQEPVEVTVRYNDAAGHKFEEKFELNFASFQNLNQVGDAPLKMIADSTKKIQKDIEGLRNSTQSFFREQRRI